MNNDASSQVVEALLEETDQVHDLEDRNPHSEYGDAPGWADNPYADWGDWGDVTIHTDSC